MSNGEARGDDRALYRNLLRLFRPYAGPVAGLLALELLDGCTALLTPVPLKIVFDSVLGSRPLAAVWTYVLPAGAAESAGGVLTLAVGLLVAVALLGNLQTLVASLVRARVGEQVVLALRCQLFRHAQRLAITHHDRVGTADANYRIQKDASAAEDLLLNAALPLGSAGLTVCLMLSVTLWLDWRTGLIAVLVAPVLLLLAWVWKPRLRQQSRAVKGLEAGALAVVQEVLATLRVVKAFGQEDREEQRFRRQSEEGVRARLRLLLAEGLYGAVIRLTTALATAAVLFVGVTRVRQGAITPGDLLLVLTYLAQLFDPLKTISRKAGGLQS